jgi:hypothetical protein
MCAWQMRKYKLTIKKENLTNQIAILSISYIYIYEFMFGCIVYTY